MSGRDFIARGLALRALAQSRLTFAALGTASLPDSITAIDSAGYSAPGLGGGRYVCDALATAALAAAHPRACFPAASGRFFRLAGDADGFITAEQMGCGAYVAGVNQQPAIQAALNYAKAVKLRGVKFMQPTYELWAPLRTGPYATGKDPINDNTNHTGNFLVVDQWDCCLLGMPGNKTTLYCKGPNGGSLMTDYQVFNGTFYGDSIIWRGNALKLTGTVGLGFPRPDASLLSHVRVENIRFLSDSVGTQNTNWPSRVSDPNSWDITNKGLYYQQDVHVGHASLTNVDIIGFLGESIYTAWTGGSMLNVFEVRLRNVVCKHSNGQAINANGPGMLDVDGFYSENCAFTLEGWGGLIYGRLVNAHFKDSKRGALTGGIYYDSGLRPDGSVPWLTVDATFENCGSVYIGSYAIGRLRLIDTVLAVVSVYSTQVIHSCNLDITAVCHRVNSLTPIRFSPWTGTSQTIRNNRFRIACQRTKYAIDNGITFAALCTQQGSLGPGNYIYARGEVAAIGTVSAVTDNYAAFVDEGLDMSTGGAPLVFDPTLVPSPDMGVGWLRAGTFSAGNGVYPVNLPATTMFSEGAELVIEHRDAGKTLCFVEIVDGGTRRALLGYKDGVKFRCNKLLARWDLVKAPAPRTASASIAIGSTATGAESGPYTIPLSGCRPWHQAQIVPPALTTGFAISAVRAETDQVKFWVRNYDGTNPATLAAQTYTARCSVAAG